VISSDEVFLAHYSFCASNFCLPSPLLKAGCYGLYSVVRESQEEMAWMV